MAETIVDSYSESHYSYGLELFNGYYTKAAQCFTGDGKNITSCKFYMQKYGNPSGNCRAVLYLMTGTYGTNGKPTGDELAISTERAANSINNSGALETFSFDGTYKLVNGTNYVISIEYSAGNGSNDLAIGVASPGHPGNKCTYLPTTWYTSSNEDLCFYVYGTLVVTSSILKVAGVAQASISKIESVTLASINKVSGVANS